MNCKICANKFGKHEEIIYLCNHKQGFVHVGCCVDNCSWDKSPCQHKLTSFMNVERQM